MSGDPTQPSTAKNDGVELIDLAGQLRTLIGTLYDRGHLDAGQCVPVLDLADDLDWRGRCLL